MCTLYETIKYLCDKKGVKPGKMCVDIGVSKSLMTSLKGGRTKSITAENAQKIADYFNVPVDYVLNGRPDSSSEQQKTPPTNEVDGIELDDVDKELLDIWNRIKPSDKPFAKDMLLTILKRYENGEE